MPGFGFGFGSHNSNARFVAKSAGSTGSTVPLISPSGNWTGIPGSGFVTLPSDPPRTGAKPMLRALVPPNQFYTDELLVGVVAGANDGGNLLENMGLASVVVHFEGTRRTITAPSFQTIEDANGIYRTYFGWWTLLRHDGRHGHGEVYFEAVPRRSGFQPRVIGPFQFGAQAKIHDGTMTVAASGAGDFRTIGEALAHCRDQRFDNPLVTILEPGNYDIATIGTTYEGAGYCTLTAAVPDVRIAKPGYAGDQAAALTSGYGGLRFRGANLTIDMRFISQIDTQAGATRSHWLDGCAIVNSAGPGATWRGGLRPVPWIVKGGAWFTECTVNDCSDAFVNARLARGTSAIGGTGELYSDCPAVIGNTSTSHRADRTLARDVPALVVQYAGTAASATIELTGSQAAASRTVTVKITGSPDRIFTLEKSEAAFDARTNYTLANLVAWLNTISGITATRLDTSESRAAAWLSLSGLAGAQFSGRDIKSGPLTLVTHIAQTPAFWRATGPTENAVVWGNVAIDMVGRVLEFDGSGAKSDLLIANNAVQNDNTHASSSALRSLLDGANDHLVFAHNTLSTQGMTLRTDASYSPGVRSLIANNSLRAIDWGGAPAATHILNNHVHGGQTAPASAAGMTNVEGTSLGGDETTLYVDHVAGDFSAANELLASPAPAILRYTANGEPIAAVDVKGTRKTPAIQQPVAPPPAPNTQSSATHNTAVFTFEPTQVSKYADGSPYAIGPLQLNSTAPPSDRISSTYLSHSALNYATGQNQTYVDYPTSAWDPAGSGNKSHNTPAYVHGLVVNPGNRAYAAGGSIANNSGTVAHFFRQGWNGISNVVEIPGVRAGEYSSTMAYRESLNIDPGKTGQPLHITSGSLVKAIVRDGRDGRTRQSPSTRDGLDWLGVLTVVTPEEAPTLENSLRPGIASANKQSHFTANDWDLSVFKNLPRVADARTAAALCASVIAPTHICHSFEGVNAGNTGPMKQGDSGYVRTMMQPLNELMASLHFDYPVADKVLMLNHLWSHFIDAHERMMEGGAAFEQNSIHGANGNPARGPLHVLIVSALNGSYAKFAYGDTARTKFDEMKAIIGSFPTRLPEYRSHFRTSQTEVLLGGNRANPQTYYRRQDPFEQWMLGVMNWGSPYTLEHNNTYHGAAYRWNVGWGGVLSSLIMQNLPQGKEVFGYDGWFTYQRQYWEREIVSGRIGGAGQENFNVRERAIRDALFIPDPVPPVPVEAHVRDNWLWLVFSKPLSEDGPINIGDFTITKNGAAITDATIAPAIVELNDPANRPVDKYSVRYGIWGPNVGIKLPAAAVYGEIYRVGYTKPATSVADKNKLSSAVDRVLVETFAPLAAVNASPPMDGQNLAYPTIIKPATTHIAIGTPGAFPLASANSSKFTFFLKGMRLLTGTGTGNPWIFGSGTEVLDLRMQYGEITLTLRDVSGLLIASARFANNIILANATNPTDLLISGDVSAASAAAGITFKANGTTVGQKSVTWNGGAGKEIGFTKPFGGTQYPHKFLGVHCEFSMAYFNFAERIENPSVFDAKTGGFLDIGTNGSGASPTNRPADIFYVGNASQLNEGSGINWGTLGAKLRREVNNPALTDKTPDQPGWR